MPKTSRKTSHDRNTGAPQGAAQPPFDIQAADVVFRTADGVDFHVYKIILSLSSPFFAEMFSLKPPPSLSDVTSVANEPIVIPETAKTFDALLRICYPVDNPDFDDLSFAETVLEAAVKYQIAVARKVISIDRFAQTHPLRVFAIACRLQLEDEAAHAADVYKKAHFSGFDNRKTVIPSELFPDSTLRLSAGQCYRLFQYCLKSSTRPILFSKHYDPCAPIKTAPLSAQEKVAPPSFTIAGADIVLRSIEGEDFATHTVLLRLVGAEALIDSTYTAISEETGPLPVTQVAVSSHTLRDFLAVLHPASCYEVNDALRLWNLTQFSIHHSFPTILDACRKQAIRVCASQPLATYLVAAHAGWQGEALTAARLLVSQQIQDMYSPVMEDTSASIYCSLLRFHRDSADSVSKVLNSSVSGCSQGITNPTLRPSSIYTPVVERELSLFVTAGSETCRGCQQPVSPLTEDTQADPAPSGNRGKSSKKRINKYYIHDPHSSCKYDVSQLLASSAALEKRIEEALLKVTLS
ncbi:hypothetical protein PHLGIDRAFT_124571 [Phlebiopsis gigantea 11061_1 CR5-6]|uniref:BTB domain-containing protein n=1 Tax=Phlebiopsis gigantea (strain 11061_1 CR5-6) TaxID=745531 RepID=A0A0C3S6M6_PHLG1|nr:hypothetical protein PHLGIDRAFT_124571 [Phlebiopsis gigantea 11061_1 CR5-6]